MHIDPYTARHTRRDIRPWARLATPVGVLALTLGLATACDDDRLTNPMPTAVSPARAPGGRYPDGRIVFLADSIGPDGERVPGAAVSLINPDGTGVVRLTPLGSFYGATWSHDRKRIAFADEATGLIGVMNANGKHLRWIGNGGHPSWSPDGQRIVVSRPTGIERTDLFVVNVDGTGEVRLTNTDNFSEQNPSWSPDGQWIAFEGIGTGREIYVMSAQGGLAKGLTECASEGMGCRSPEWAPSADSPAIAYVAQRDGLAQFRVLDLTTRQTVSLADDLPGVSGPSWSPDGRYLVFGSRRASPAHPALYSVEIATNAIQRRSFGAGEHDPSWR